MNDYLISLILGIVEGLTEFLPVSSTAHLRIGQALLGINLEDDYWKMYAIVIQLGAVLCLPVYFRKRILDFLRSFPRGHRGDLNWLTHPLSLTMAAFVVTAAPALLLTKVIGKNLESLLVIGLSLLIGGAVMWVVDVAFNRPVIDDMERTGLWRALWIGAAQILSAVFPGTSRSMSTIAAGQVAGMSRSAALEFSFFLSMPTMAAATGYDLLKAIRGGGGDGALAPLAMDMHRWGVLAIGFVVSFIVALAVVHWFMGWVRRHGFVPFAVYRLVAGCAVLLWWSRA